MLLILYNNSFLSQMYEETVTGLAVVSFTASGRLQRAFGCKPVMKLFVYITTCTALPDRNDQKKAKLQS